MSSHTNVFTYPGDTIRAITPEPGAWQVIVEFRDGGHLDLMLHLTREAAELLVDELGDALSVGPDDGSDDLNDRIKGK